MKTMSIWCTSRQNYGGLLPNVGINAYGIGQFINSVYPNDSHIGIPRVIVSRAVLAAKTPGEAIRSTLVPHRAAGYNHLIVHESGEIYSVEVSARRFAILYAEKMVMLLVADLTTREMHMAWGNPCNNPYHTYHLEA